MDKITDEKLEKYLSLTQKALKKAKIAPPKKTELYKTAAMILDMSQRYYEDAKHFTLKKDKVNAFACINYSHGWLDCAASLGLLDVDHDNKLFTVD